MNLWWQVPLLICAVALAVVFAGAIAAARQTLRRAEQLLATLDQELRPTLEELRGLTRELQATTHEARNGVIRVAAVVDHVSQMTVGVATLVTGLRGLTQVGQVIAVVAGVRKGLD